MQAYQQPEWRMTSASLVYSSELLQESGARSGGSIAKPGSDIPREERAESAKGQAPTEGNRATKPTGLPDKSLLEAVDTALAMRWVLEVGVALAAKRDVIGASVAAARIMCGALAMGGSVGAAATTANDQKAALKWLEAAGTLGSTGALLTGAYLTGVGVTMASALPVVSVFLGSYTLTKTVIEATVPSVYDWHKSWSLPSPSQDSLRAGELGIRRGSSIGY